MKTITRFIVAILFLLSIGCAKYNDSKNTDLTWTYTYIKAKEAKKEVLKEILLKNWFVMDSIAVEQGLFNDYELIENLNESSEREWDYIVAVEYFTKNTYADISKEFQEIRKNHKTVKVQGLTFPEAGAVVRSEVVKKSH